jgi:CheY-like chemotaxis protein
MSAPTPTILLVEDNDDDVFAMQRALRKTQIACSMQVVSDGQKAIDYLSGNGAYADRQSCPLPSIIFLDLKLPYVDGFELLQWLRAQPQFREIAVVILTGSAEQSDRDRASKLGVRFYLVKPPEAVELSKLVAEVTGR